MHGTSFFVWSLKCSTLIIPTRAFLVFRSVWSLSNVSQFEQYFCGFSSQTVPNGQGRFLFPLNRRMKTSFQIASAFPQVRSLKLQLLSSWRSCWYESGTNRAEVRTRRFWQCSGGSRKRTRRRLPPRASSPCSHGCRCPWRSASCSARRAPASPWGARR